MGERLQQFIAVLRIWRPFVDPFFLRVNGDDGLTPRVKFHLGAINILFYCQLGFGSINWHQLWLTMFSQDGRISPSNEAISYLLAPIIPLVNVIVDRAFVTMLMREIDAGKWGSAKYAVGKVWSISIRLAAVCIFTIATAVPFELRSLYPTLVEHIQASQQTDLAGKRKQLEDAVRARYRAHDEKDDLALAEHDVAAEQLQIDKERAQKTEELAAERGRLVEDKRRPEIRLTKPFLISVGDKIMHDSLAQRHTEDQLKRAIAALTAWDTVTEPERWRVFNEDAQRRITEIRQQRMSASGKRLARMQQEIDQIAKMSPEELTRRTGGNAEKPITYLQLREALAYLEEHNPTVRWNVWSFRLVIFIFELISLSYAGMFYKDLEPYFRRPKTRAALLARFNEACLACAAMLITFRRRCIKKATEVDAKKRHLSYAEMLGAACDAWNELLPDRLFDLQKAVDALRAEEIEVLLWPVELNDGKDPRDLAYYGSVVSREAFVSYGWEDNQPSRDRARDAARSLLLLRREIEQLLVDLETEFRRSLKAKPRMPFESVHLSRRDTWNRRVRPLLEQIMTIEDELEIDGWMELVVPWVHDPRKNDMHQLFCEPSYTELKHRGWTGPTVIEHCPKCPDVPHVPRLHLHKKAKPVS